MKRAAMRIRPAAGPIAAIPIALAALGAPALAAGAVLVALVVIAATCWTISDTDRTQRLAALINATRARPSIRRADPSQTSSASAVSRIQDAWPEPVTGTIQSPPSAPARPNPR
jgi:hypothetical protein